MRREKTSRKQEPVTYSPVSPQEPRSGIRPYRRILVPLDGTPVAEAALRPAAELAARAGATVNLVGVATETVGTAVPVDPIHVPGVAEAIDHHQDRERLLREACIHVRDEWGCRTTYELLTDTSAADAIMHAAERLEADLVVAATHMRGWLSRTILGSTAEDLVEAGSFPVLIVPAEGPEPGAATPMQGPVESIVVAVDPDARMGDRAIAHAVHWAQLWNARLTLAQSVMVMPLPAPGPEAGGPIAPVPPLVPGYDSGYDPRDLASAKLAVIRDALRQEGLDTREEVLDGDGPADALLRYVESSGADLLVVGRHRKSFWDRLFEGSESSKLARRIRGAGLLVCHEDAR
jgi:nucleotide-binding universal stress UspA family protein